METVIAIGVLAVLLTGFIAVFAPATQGIRRSISIQQAGRLVSTLEKELTTLRTDPTTDMATGFDKAFTWVKESNTPGSALFIYQYRGDPENPRDEDGTLTPVPDATGQPGVDYVVQSILRRLDDDLFSEDLAALEGQIFYVKLTQLISDTTDGGLVEGTPGTIQSASTSGGGGAASSSSEYEEAAIAFVADFYNVPTKAEAYLTGDDFSELFEKNEKPVFSRNMAVRR